MSQKNKRKAVHKNRKTDDVEKQREDTDPELTEWEKSRRRIWIYVKVSSVFALLIVTLYAGKWVYESNKLTTLEEECRVAKKKGDWITLEIKAREWASWEPDNYMPWMYAATAVQENGGTPTELAAYLKQLPENAPFLAFQELSDIRYRSGEVKDAAKIFEQLVERDPTSVEAHRRLNFYYAMTVQRAKLINESMRAIELGAATPESFVYLVGADWLTFTNGYEVVAKWAEKYPNDNEDLQVASAVHLITAGYSESMTENPRMKELLANRKGLLKSLTKKFPDNIELLALQLSQAAFLADDETVRDLLSGVKANVDDDSRFWRFKGWYHAFHEQWAEAKEAYTTCLELNPYDWLCMHELSGVLRQLEEKEELKRIQAISFIGKQIQRDVLQAPRTDQLPIEVLLKIEKFIRDCGQAEVASKLSDLIKEMQRKQR